MIFTLKIPPLVKANWPNHRVIPYHWKGMNGHQRQEILNEQDKQRKETEKIKKLRDGRRKKCMPCKQKYKLLLTLLLTFRSIKEKCKSKWKEKSKEERMNFSEIKRNLTFLRTKNNKSKSKPCMVK